MHSVYNLLHEAIPNPGVSMGMASVTTAALLTALHPLASNSTIMRVQVQDGDIYHTVDGSTPSASNGFLVYQGAEMWFNRATYEACRVIAAEGSPVLAVTQMVYANSQTLRAPGLTSLLRTETFKSIFDWVVRTMGNNVETWETNANDYELDMIADAVTNAMAKCWEWAFWPDLHVVSYAEPDEDDGLSVISAQSAALANLGIIQQISVNHPFGPKPVEINDYTLAGDGIYFQRPVSACYIAYRPRPPKFVRSKEYSAGTTYQAGDVVYWPSTGECYMALQGTTGNSPSNLTYWERQQIPYYFQPYLRYKAYAEVLLADGQKIEKIDRYNARAEDLLISIHDRHIGQAGFHRYAQVN